MNWNYDVDKAPKGTYSYTTRFLKDKKVQMSIYHAPRVILAVRGPDGQETVLLSRWLERIENKNGSVDGDRWDMISKKDEVVAWAPWPEFPSCACSSDSRDVKRSAP